MLKTMSTAGYLELTLFVDAVGQLCENQLLLFGTEQATGLDVKDGRDLGIDLVDILAARPGRAGKNVTNNIFGNGEFASHTPYYR